MRSIDIRTLFVHAKGLDKEVYLEPPKYVKHEPMIWRLRKPLYGLNDVSRKFCLKVKRFFHHITLVTGKLHFLGIISKKLTNESQ